MNASPMSSDGAWIWIGQHDALIRMVAYYDDLESTFASSNVISEGGTNPESGVALFNIKNRISYVDTFHCLPTIASAPVVDKILADIIAEIAGESAVQFYPVIIRARDGETDRFAFAIPRYHISCTDLEQSEVKVWIIPGVDAGSMRSIVHRPNCLGNRHFARDRHFRAQILVSEKLKNALEETGDPGLNFVRPEDYPVAPPAFR